MEQPSSTIYMLPGYANAFPVAYEQMYVRHAMCLRLASVLISFRMQDTQGPGIIIVLVGRSHPAAESRIVGVYKIETASDILLRATDVLHEPHGLAVRHSGELSERTARSREVWKV